MATPVPPAAELPPPPPPAAAVVMAPLAGGTDEDTVEDTKTKKKGLFSFGADKKAKAQSEQEAQEAKEKAAREKEKKQEEEEEMRIEQQQENSRLEEKRERQQELLKQVIDPSTRVFQLNMKAMKITNHSGSQQSGLFIKVKLGGDYEEKEEPGKGLVKKGTKGQVFTTAASAKIEHEGTYYIKGEFGAGIPIYWMGSYGGLEVQDFVLEVWAGRLLQRPRKCAEFRCPLSAIAQGSIQQELEMHSVRAPPLPGQLGAPVERQHFVNVSYVIYLQELFVFQLKFANWKGYSLRAADVAKRKERVMTSMSHEDKSKRRREERESKRELKKQKDRERRERAREQRQQAMSLRMGDAPADAKRSAPHAPHAPHASLLVGHRTAGGDPTTTGGAEGTAAEGGAKVKGAEKVKLLEHDGAKEEGGAEESGAGGKPKPKPKPKKRSQMSSAEQVEP